MNSTLKAGLILITVFAMGVMVGVAGLRNSHKPPQRSPGNDPYRQDPEVVDHIHKRLTESYNFSPEQQMAVRKILEESQKRYDDFFSETRPTFEQIRRDQRDAIRKVMNPDQLAKFEAWIEQRRKNRPEGERGPRPDGERRPRGPQPDGKNSLEGETPPR